MREQRVLDIARAVCAYRVVVVVEERGARVPLKEKDALSDLLHTVRGEDINIVLVEQDVNVEINLLNRVVEMRSRTQCGQGRLC